ncbi:MAG: fumarylacetoacetate hydrolase family protein [Anaerolineae bacterium]
MKLCRFFVPEEGPHLGAVVGEMVYDLTSLGDEVFSSFSALLAFSRELEGGLVPFLEESLKGGSPAYAYQDLDQPPAPDIPHLLSPIDVQEVWGAGVTYLRSKEAREGESAEADFYGRVYEAVRPEIFFKTTPHRVVGPNDYVCVRRDSTWTSPEPEFTLVLNTELALVGYTIGNDMTARDIEGENPLYLPQAKTYSGCCALGPVITLAEAVSTPRNLPIECAVFRGDQAVFQGSTSTSRIKRDFGELIAYLGRDNTFPHGVVLLTGTGIVPPDDFRLQDGDLVEIKVEGIGTLRNPVRQLS